MTVETYSRRTAGYTVLFGLLGLLLIVNGQPLFGILAFFGSLQTELVLYSKRVARQDNIQRSMPDFLDVLAVTVSAGLSFRLALSRVAESMPGPLAEEFMVALRQMELGTPRREAFEDLRNRNSSEAVNLFVTAILQAEELGAPLGTALVDIGADMRRESAQWAKRKAQRTTPKITAITMSMTLPALMLVVLGALFIGSGMGVQVGSSGSRGGVFPERVGSAFRMLMEIRMLITALSMLLLPREQLTVGVFALMMTMVLVSWGTARKWRIVAPASPRTRPSTPSTCCCRSRCSASAGSRVRTSCPPSPRPPSPGSSTGGRACWPSPACRSSSTT